MKRKALNALLSGTDYVLNDNEGVLVLTHKTYSPLSVDFLSSATQYRKVKGGGYAQLIAKACQAGKKPLVFDITAGLGRDAYVLASLGCQVKMFERDPVIAALLCDGLKRLKHSHPEIALSLIQKDCRDFLNGLVEPDYPDVIYFDPMHPLRKKSALVKKEMRIVSEIVGADVDKETVFELARTKMKKRLVVKWPIDQAPITENPMMSYRGKSTRYDVFLRKVQI